MVLAMKANIPYAFITTLLSACVATFSEIWTWIPRSLYTSMLLWVIPLTVCSLLTCNLPKFYTSYLLGLNATCHFSAHSCRWSISHLFFWQYSSLFTTPPILASSTNLLTNPFTLKSKSFIQITNSRGPSTDPWWAPLVTDLQLEYLSSTTLSSMLQPVLNSYIQIIVNPVHLNLLDQATMRDLIKNLTKIHSYNVHRLTFINLIRHLIKIKFVRHDLLHSKPCELSLISQFSSWWKYILSRRILSNSFPTIEARLTD